MEIHEKTAEEIGKLVAEKNAAYGDSFARCGDFLRLLYPKGISPEQYGDMLAMVRIFDKFKRIATNADAFGEDPRRDVAGYGLLMAVSKLRSMDRCARVAAGLESIDGTPITASEDK